MRTTITLAFAFILATIAAIGLSQTTASAAAPTPQRKAVCEEQKKACITAGTQTGTYGERYVPPEVVKQCYDAYRGCISHN
jgi:hypothetical protein